jgi:hypothetical protein
VRGDKERGREEEREKGKKVGKERNEGARRKDIRGRGDVPATDAC